MADRETPPPDSPPPDSPRPDSKDWTWVLDERCPEGGFDAGAFDHTEVGARLRANSSRWMDVLRLDGVATRPSPRVWSPLEYAGHVRDVHVLYLARLEMMLDEDGPHYPNWDQDETAIAERYHEAEPAVVAQERRRRPRRALPVDVRTGASATSTSGTGIVPSSTARIAAT